jgi:sulfoxide reductase catalytic subunit YedY
MNSQYKSVPVKSSEITPYSLYLSRRDFIKAAGLATGTALLAACAPNASPTVPAEAGNLPQKNDELGDPTNTYEEITNYNNFYEFTTDKQGVAGLSQDFNPTPWTVEVSGLVNNPRRTASRTCSAGSHRRSASTACAVWRPGAWSSHGTDFLSQAC